MNKYNESIEALLEAIAELRRAKLERTEHFKRWINLCAALTTDLEDHYCQRSKQRDKIVTNQVA